MIIAMDGPAGTGKGTIAKLIADRLNFVYIDTGAMYRCITLQMLRSGVSLDDLDKINDILNFSDILFKNIDNKQHVFLDGEDVSDLIRKPNVNALVAQVSKLKDVRVKLVDMQRKMSNLGSDIIMEGRDITTVVFPCADLKIYLDASLEVRAMRRYNELINKGENVTYEDTLENVRMRDETDKNKEIGALKIADDAVYIDSSDLTIEEVYNKVYAEIKKVKAYND